MDQPSGGANPKPKPSTPRAAWNASGMWLLLVLMMALGFLYFGLLTASTSQATLGKSLMGLKVTDHGGRRLSLTKSFMRAGMSFGFEFIPLIALINIFLAITSDMGWTMYDRLTESQVVEAG